MILRWQGTTDTGHSTRIENAEDAEAAQLRLKLYVAGQSPKSSLALQNLMAICDKYVRCSYFIEVIDLLRSPHLAKDDQIFAIPTLIRHEPQPLARIIGDLSNTDRVLASLNLPKLAFAGGAAGPPPT